MPNKASRKPQTDKPQTQTMSRNEKDESCARTTTWSEDIHQKKESCIPSSASIQNTLLPSIAATTNHAVACSTFNSNDGELWNNVSTTGGPTSLSASLDQPRSAIVDTYRGSEPDRNGRPSTTTIEESWRRPRKRLLPSAPLRNSFVVRSTRRGSEEWRNLVKPFVADLVFRSLYQPRFQGDFKFRPYTSHAAVVRRRGAYGSCFCSIRLTLHMTFSIVAFPNLAVCRFIGLLANFFRFGGQGSSCFV
jgi:hypothetical protein